jgi:eukaryotic-like serine/threonine-protein kinase
MATPDNASRWDRVEQLFHAALEQPAEARARFLDSACASDPLLRREVDSLLAAAGNSLLERPAAAHLGLPAAAPRAWAPGATIGPYRILEPLGAGGMGEVFRARDTRLDRDVALKTLSPYLALDHSYLERLRREARALASVNHPNVATLHGIEEVDGHIALVMELVEGETLARRLSRSRLPLADALAIATQIAGAVEAAHRKGVVHRDLKPGNVMLARGGLVKVLDFGLARRGDALHPEDTGVTRTAPLTSRGAVLGTPGYMSPEQAEGGPIDTRSDIFSFGAILYELIGGSPAFGGDTAAQRTASLLRDEPEPLESRAPNTPRSLLRLICRCLRKSTEDRYQSITDVRFALEEAKEDLDRGQPAATVPRRSRILLGTALAAALAAVVYFAIQLQRAQSPPILVTPLTMYEGFAQGPAISPDGKMVAFTWGGERQDNTDVYVKLAGAGEPLRLTNNPAPESRPLWSPDGRTIAFSRLRDSGGAGLGTEAIFTVPVLGGPERRVGAGFASDWSPDGSTFLALLAPPGQPSEMVLVSAADGSSRPLTKTPPGSTTGRGRFSPDGRKVYFIEQTGPAESHLNQIDLAGGAPKPVPISGLRSIDSFAWAGPDEWILFGRTAQSVIPRLYKVAVSGGSPRPLPFGTNGSGIDTSSATGTLVYGHDQLSENIWRVGAWPGADREPRKWIASDMPSLSPVVAPAGDRIAFASIRSGLWTIWASDAEGNGAAPAARFPAGATAMVGSPYWSPDGKQVAFDAYIGNYPNIFASAIGSSEPPHPLTQGNGRNIIPIWSPDGRWIYYTSSVTGAQTIWRIPAAGGEPRQITKQGGYSAKLSPDGKYLYYLKNRREGELWRAPAEGGEEELLVREFKSRNFWVLPEGVYHLDPGVTEMSPMSRGRARFYRFQTKKIEDLGFETQKPINHYGICLSPDGKWLYYTQADRSGSNIMLVENFR